MPDFDDIMRIQRQMLGRIARENEMDKKIELLQIIQSIRPQKDGRIQIETILLEAQYSGMVEGEVMDLLDELSKDNLIREEPGFIRLT